LINQFVCQVVFKTSNVIWAKTWTKILDSYEFNTIPTMYGALFSYIMVSYNSLWELHWNHKILRILNSQLPKLRHLSQDLFNVVSNSSINHHLTFQGIVVLGIPKRNVALGKDFNSQNSIVNYIFYFLLYFELGGMPNKFSKLQYT
jgi:hypothetical protein